ncbi:5'/3'-nucleotidase SurE [Desertimonas flava]|uniref:5'/3'-nucleotidase SurE n=1 Tax=Desertimonas flava TaxID=2064846 RepID=UPI000E34515E|nr:5'/3'-nucleotidase SurE [Desertimonas flava]
MTEHRGPLRLAAATVATIAASAALAAGVSASAPPDSSAPADLSGVEILLTNDDGVQAEGAGLAALRERLCAAGADVVTVAPWSQQSGTSASITFGATFAVATPDGATDACADAPSGGTFYGVCLSDTACVADSESATPSDAVALGLHAVVPELGWDGGPDVVLVGINDGGNEGLNVPLSGTIGAATWADIYGAPTIALSAKGDPTPESLADNGDWAAGLVAALIAADALPDGYVLSVNFPDPENGAPTGVEWTALSDVTWGGTLYERDGDVFATSYGECSYDACGFPAEGSDDFALQNGAVSVSPIVVDRTVGVDIDTTRAEAVVESLAP